MAKVLWSADRRIWKDNGDPAADGTLAFRLADSSTPATVYSDRSLSVSLGSSVNISSDGYLSSNVTVYGADDVGYDAVVTATGVNGGAPKTIPDVAIADSSVAADSSYRTGFKNVVNNGDFAVWSDQTSYSNISGDDDGDETADGWFFAQPSAASNAVSRQTGEATASRYGLRFGRPAASTSTNKLRVWKMLTTEEVYRLRGQTVVFSVYLRSGANFSAASLNCKLATGTSEGEDGDLIESGGLAGFAQPINHSQAITTSITRYSFSATLGATIKEAGVQFSYTGVGTAGANDWVQIEQVQVEVATTVSEFEAVPETLEFLIGKLSSVARTLVKQTTQALMRTTGLGISAVADTLITQTTQALMRTTGLGFTSAWSALVSGGAELVGRNALANGDFRFGQRGTSFTSATTPANSDDTYLLDRWYVLSDGNDIVDVTQETSTVPTGGQTAIALDVETINKKFGIAQIVEHRDCKGLIGETVTLSFKAKVSDVSKLDNVKCAIIAWDGTADSVTSDVISAWGSEGTNPTLVANCTYENTPTNLGVTTSYATYSVSASVDTANAKNIIVFIWSDVTDTTLAHFLYITDVQLEYGSVATRFENVRHGIELRRCQRYYEKSFRSGTAPAQNTASASDEFTCTQPGGASAAQTTPFVTFQATKRNASSTITLYNIRAANAQIRNITRSTDFSSSTASWVTESGFNCSGTSPGGSSAGDLLAFGWTADNEL